MEMIDSQQMLIMPVYNIKITRRSRVHYSTWTFPGLPTCRGLLNSLLTLAGIELGRGERGGGSAILSNSFRFDCLDFAWALAALGVVTQERSSKLETLELCETVLSLHDVDRASPAKRCSWPFTLDLFSWKRHSMVKWLRPLYETSCHIMIYFVNGYFCCCSYCRFCSVNVVYCVELLKKKKSFFFGLAQERCQPAHQTLL